MFLLVQGDMDCFTDECIDSCTGDFLNRDQRASIGLVVDLTNFQLISAELVLDSTR